MQKLLLLAATKKPYEVDMIQFLEFYLQDFDEDLLRGQLKLSQTVFQPKKMQLLQTLFHSVKDQVRE